MQPIQSAQNAAFQRLLGLSKEAKARQAAGLLLVEGPHLAAEAMAHSLAQQVWVTPEAWADPEEGPALNHQAQQAKVPLGVMGASLLVRRSG